MRELLSSAILLLAFSFSAFGQTPCPDEAGLFCDPLVENGAPIICDLNCLDGFSSSTPDTLLSPQPMLLCESDGDPNNMSWFAFVAGIDSINLTVTPSNCTDIDIGNGNSITGIQAGIYSSCDFNDSANLIVCDNNCTDVASPITLSSGDLITGQTYFFFVDGCGGSICDYTISVNYGVQPFELPEPEVINCELTECDTICVGAVDVNFSLDTFDLDIYYYWTISPPTALYPDTNGDGKGEYPLNDQYSVFFDFPEEGTFRICAIADNSCDQTAELCKEVVVKALEDEHFTDITVCPEDFPINPMDPPASAMNLLTEDPNMDGFIGWGGTDYIFTSGTAEHTITNSLGCQYKQYVKVDQEQMGAREDVVLAYCEADLPVFYHGIEISTTFEGEHYALDNLASTGCDSLISLSAYILDVQGEIVISECNTDRLELAFDVNSTNPVDYDNLIYIWKNEDGTEITDTDGMDSVLLVPNTGKYLLEVQIEKAGTICSFPFEIETTLPEVDFSISADTICIMDQVVVTFEGTDPDVMLNWDFGSGSESGSGPYDVSFSTSGLYEISLEGEKDGCISGKMVRNVLVQDSLENFQIVCVDQTETSITFEWDDIENVSEYLIYIDNALVGNGVSNTFTQNDLLPGQSIEIVVEALSSNLCPGKITTTSCSTDACITTGDVDIIPRDTSLCLPKEITPFELSYTLTDLMDTGVITWKGQGINSNGIFDPQSLSDGDYEIILDYEINGCIFSDSIMISLIESPEMSFISADTICVTDSLFVQNTSTFLSGSELIWSTSGGHFLNTGNLTAKVWWDEPGLYELSLSGSRNGCEGEAFSKLIYVEKQHEPIEVFCEADDSSITFFWDAVDCALGYKIIVNGVELVQADILTYEIENLKPGDVIEITIEAVTNCACGNVSSPPTICMTEECPEIEVDLSYDPLISCEGDIVGAYPIQLSLTGDVSEGTEEWQGNGVNADGLFDHDIAGVGEHMINYIYTEGSCTFEDSINITILETPKLEVLVESPECFDELVGSLAWSGSGGVEPYVFRLNGEIIDENELDNVLPGFYVLEIIDENLCSDMEEVEVVLPSSLHFEIIGDTVVNEGNPVSLSLSMTNVDNFFIDSIIWTVDNEVICGFPENCLNISFDTEESSTICLEIYYNGSCMVDTCTFVRIKIEDVISIPNIFSPGDNNSLNDEFFILSNNPAIRANKLRIFDRWGNLVFTADDFSTTDTAVRWDGTYNGKLLNPGVYVYYLELEDGEGNVSRKMGDITLLR